MNGKGKQVGAYMAAIRWYHRMKGDEGETDKKRVRLVEKGITRVSATEGNLEERQPFPLVALKSWVREKRGEGIRVKRDPAMVALGIRCMRRPSELTYLRRRHVKWIMVE